MTIPNIFLSNAAFKASENQNPDPDPSFLEMLIFFKYLQAQQSTIPDDSLVTVNCTVAYMAQCMSWNKCKASCTSMGASSYRYVALSVPVPTGMYSSMGASSYRYVTYVTAWVPVPTGT